MKSSGIYEIVNLKNGRRYVGSAVNLGRRWYMHKYHLMRGTHWSAHLQATWNKHGDSNFAFRPLLLCARQNLIMYEQIAINALKPEYNKCPTAGSSLGRKASPETLAKLSARASNISAETRARMSAGQSRRRHTPETKAKLSAIFSGRIVSQETRAKNSASLMGHSVSAETRAKISAANKGRKNSAEAIAKTAAASTGRKHTPEAKAKISAANRGKKPFAGRVHSAETKAKLSAITKARRAESRGDKT